MTEAEKMQRERLLADLGDMARIHLSETVRDAVATFLIERGWRLNSQWGVGAKREPVDA